MPATPPFVHLHVHTHYSLLDGASRIDELIASAKSQNMPAIAITDHGNMFGVIEFYLAAKKAGIKPILGMEAYIEPAGRTTRDAKSKGDAAFHLLLLAMNRAGYQNLIKLSSIAYREGFYYVPRIDREVLAAHADGLICTSTCLGAEIPQSLINKDRAAANEIVDWYLSTFGPDRFFIELQDHGIPEQHAINPELIDIAAKKSLGLIVTNDVHYLRADDVEPHDILCCINTKALQSDEKRFKFPTGEFYLKSPDQMAALFPNLPEAVSNTAAIADRCNLELDFTKRYTPVYHPPESKSPETYLRELVYQGAHERYNLPIDPSAVSDGSALPLELKERIDYELDVIQSKGFSSYFLIVWDFVHYARDRGIPCGARGSGCSSVVAYCLYLSQPDPLRYGLYFERFMDPDRDEMPDIDIDICQDGRDEVLRYVRDKYGHVAQIVTFGTLKARAVIRDVCRVTGVPLSEADRIAKLVPEELKMTLDKALAQEPELQRLYDDDPRVRKVLDVGRRLEGLVRNTSIHAAGVVIADVPLDTLLPLCKQSGSDALLTQFEGNTVEKVGLLKMDILGLRTLSVLARAVALVEQNHHVKIDLEHLNLEDPAVFSLFAAGHTKGVFQFESGGMRDVIMKMRPTRIEDLIAANALYRPGPMVNIDAYIARKHGDRWTTPHKIMNEVLAETFGIIVYQEQVARLVHQLGGIERKRAFRLAKAISKKKTAMIEAEREPFRAGASANGLDRATADQIFNQILPFGEYAFNKAHSTGYALVAFQTAFIKTYYPLEFMAALLTYEMGDTDKVVDYIDECKRLGIDVRPPDVNSSDADFTVVRPPATPNPAVPAANPDSSSSNSPFAICNSQFSPSGFLRFGLAAIKGVGQKAVQSIAQARAQAGPFRDLFDFCERVDLTIVNRGVAEALIKAGAFDATGAMRKALVLALDAALQSAARTQQDRASGQLSMFDAFESTAADAPPPPKISSDEWTEAEMLANEKAVLGFYVTKHPLAACADEMARFATADCADVADLKQDAEIVLGGIISKLRKVVTKSGRNAGSKLAVLSFEDLTGAIEAVVFSEQLEEFGRHVAPDKLVYLRGTVDRRRENPSLRVSKVIPFADGPAQLAESVLLTLSTLGLAGDRIEQLRDVCRAHSGSTKLFLKMLTPDGAATIVRCGDELSVRSDAAFKRAMESVLGPDSVEIIGPRRPQRRPIPTPPAAPQESLLPLDSPQSLDPRDTPEPLAV